MKYVLNHKYYLLKEPLVKYRRVRNNNKSLSANNRQNYIRMQNETSLIAYDFINKISRSNFYRIFENDILQKHEHDNIHEICEKYIILNKWSKNYSDNHIPAILYIQQHLSNDKIILCLEEDYHITLNDIYKHLGDMIIEYPMDFYSDYKNLSEAYNFVINSKT